MHFTVCTGRINCCGFPLISPFSANVVTLQLYTNHMHCYTQAEKHDDQLLTSMRGECRSIFSSEKIKIVLPQQIQKFYAEEIKIPQFLNLWRSNSIRMRYLFSAYVVNKLTHNEFFFVFFLIKKLTFL